MWKIVLCACASLVVCTSCSGGGNWKMVGETNYQNAVVRMPEGDFVKGRVEEWVNGGDMVSVKIDGVTYKTSPINVVLYTDKK